MRQLGYYKGLDKWIKHYHSTISNQNKSYIAAAFKVCKNKNIKCTILIVIDTYSINVDI